MLVTMVWSRLCAHSGLDTKDGSFRRSRDGWKIWADSRGCGVRLVAFFWSHKAATAAKSPVNADS